MNKRLGANRRKKRSEVITKIKTGRLVRRAFSWSAGAAVAAALCVGGCIAARGLWIQLGSSERFTVHSIEVRGARRIGAAEISRLSGLHEGMPMSDVKPRAAEKGIGANCWIRKANVARGFPDKVVLSVEERAPIALVNAGRVYYLDDEGVLLPLFQGTYSDLPVISGIDAGPDCSVGKKVSAENMRRVKSFLAEIEKNGVLSTRRLSQIDFSGAAGVKLALENSRTLVELDDKQGLVGLARLKGLIDVFENSSEGMPKRINLCYDNLAYAQW
jgi:cell division septal protein FtsQ